MASRRRPQAAIGLREVMKMLDEQLPTVEWDGCQDWDRFVAAARARRDERRALLAQHGYSAMDAFRAKWGYR